MRFSITGAGAGARFTQLPSLITSRPPSQGDGAATANTTRSILFPAGTLYYSRGIFSHQDAAGTARVGF
jgi:hypothetical protein